MKLVLHICWTIYICFFLIHAIWNIWLDFRLLFHYFLSIEYLKYLRVFFLKLRLFKSAFTMFTSMPIYRKINDSYYLLLLFTLWLFRKEKDFTLLYVTIFFTYFLLHPRALLSSCLFSSYLFVYLVATCSFLSSCLCLLSLCLSCWTYFMTFCTTYFNNVHLLLYTCPLTLIMYYKIIHILLCLFGHVLSSFYLFVFFFFSLFDYSSWTSGITLSFPLHFEHIWSGYLCPISLQYLINSSFEMNPFFNALVIGCAAGSPNILG